MKRIKRILDQKQLLLVSKYHRIIFVGVENLNFAILRSSSEWHQSRLRVDRGE